LGSLKRFSEQAYDVISPSVCLSVCPMSCVNKVHFMAMVTTEH